MSDYTRSGTCMACDPEGWVCERRAHTDPFHATCLVEYENVQWYPIFDEKNEPINAERVWVGTTRWQETANKVFDLVANFGVQLASELSELTGLSIHTVRKHLTRLRKDGLVEYSGRGLWS